MYLVLCNTSDLAALWAYLQLKKDLGEAIDIVTAEVLAHARWEHRLTTNGTSTTIALTDGRVIRSDDVRATLNRLEHIAPVSARAGAADREYATAEMHALFASWLHGLPGRIWNRATPAGLSGSVWRKGAEWLQLAARAGFAAVPLDQTRLVRTRRLVVAGETVVGTAPAAVKSSALALSRAVDASILGIELTHDWRFLAATPRPDLRDGGAALVDALRGQLFAEAA